MYFLRLILRVHLLEMALQTDEFHRCVNSSESRLSSDVDLVVGGVASKLPETVSLWDTRNSCISKAAFSRL